MTKRKKIEKRGKSSYAYEVTSEYDPTIKNTRSTKRYLGKVNGYDEAGDPIIGRKWIKKSILQNILDESHANLQHHAFLESLILNKPYQLPRPKTLFQDPKPRSQSDTFFYFYGLLEEFNMLIELLVSPYNIKSNYINISLTKKYESFSNIKRIVISDSQNSLGNLKGKPIILIRSQETNTSFSKVTILDRFVLADGTLGPLLKRTEEILAVLIFNEIVDLINTKKDINSSACESIVFFFNEIIRRCLTGKSNPLKSLKSVYLELKKTVSQQSSNVGSNGINKSS